MGSERFILPGVLIGCLTLKPQLGVMIPVALLASRQWTTTAAATAMAAIVALVPTLWVGPEFWFGLREVLNEHYAIIVEGGPGLHLMPSVYSEARALGAGHGVGLVLQWSVTGPAAIAAALTWMSRQVGWDPRAAVLVTAIPVSTPYLWYYDTVLTAAAGLFLLHAGVLSLGRFWRVALFWAAPAPPRSSN